MKRLILPLIGLFCFSCEPSKEHICKNIDESVRKYYEDVAFKENKPIRIYEIKTVSFREMGQKQLDSLRIVQYIFRDTLGKLDAKLQATLASSYDADDYRAKEATQESERLKDTAAYYHNKSIALQKTVKGRQGNPGKYYYSKTYVKMTMDSVNTLDTLHYAVDENFKPINLNY